ncbi:hypothetical protein ASC95_08500 [Pelomonas sp. Root1217]|nr:hypothetical protein ASC95_08500 [Pelomonas sp. Root1217]
MARLHGPDRSPAVDRACLAWQVRSVVHRLAFERCTDTWQDVRGVTLSGYAAAVGAARRAGLCGAGQRRLGGVAALVV